MTTKPAKSTPVTSSGAESLQPKRVFIDLDTDETINDEWEPVKPQRRVSAEKQELVIAEAKRFLAKANVRVIDKPSLDKTKERNTTGLTPCISKLQ